MKRPVLLSAAAICLAGIATSTQALPFVSGDVFAADGGGTIKHYSSAGVLKETLTSGSGTYQTGMAFDASGNLYSTNFDSGTITRYDTNGAVIAPNPFVTIGGLPESIAFNTAGQFYVGRAGSQVQKFSAAGALLATYSMPQNTDWIDLAADQTTLYYNDEGGVIKKWNVATNTAIGTFASDLTAGGTNSYALRILSNGHVLSAGNSKVVEFDASGAVVGTYAVSGVTGLFSLNLDPNGTSFWTGSDVNQTLYKFTIGNFGTSFTQSINAGGSLFGVAIAGEITAGGPGPGVPEPATWALMIVGFALTGIAARHRQKVVAA